MAAQKDVVTFWKNQGYRACAGILLFNKKKEVLICRRNTTAFVSWQFVQGGVDPGETFEEGGLREMEEEIGLSPSVVNQVGDLSEVVCYDVNRDCWLTRSGYKGQAICFTLAYWNGDVKECDISQGIDGHKAEFSDIRWMPLNDWEKDLTPTVPDFKKELYAHLREWCTPTIQSYSP